MVLERDDDLANRIREILETQNFAVLSTTDDEKRPYASLVAFQNHADLKKLVFATSRHTRKFANLRSNPRAALLVDTRKNEQADFADAAAVTIVGKVSEVTGSKRDEAVNGYLLKHPNLLKFITSPDCAVLEVRVRVYFLVERFQEVRELRI